MERGCGSVVWWAIKSLSFQKMLTTQRYKFREGLTPTLDAKRHCLSDELDLPREMWRWTVLYLLVLGSSYKYVNMRRIGQSLGDRCRPDWTALSAELCSSRQSGVAGNSV